VTPRFVEAAGVPALATLGWLPPLRSGDLSSLSDEEIVKPAPDAASFDATAPIPAVEDAGCTPSCRTSAFIATRTGGRDPAGADEPADGGRLIRRRRLRTRVGGAVRQCRVPAREAGRGDVRGSSATPKGMVLSSKKKRTVPVRKMPDELSRTIDGRRPGRAFATRRLRGARAE